jgi:hypothetical protein
MALSINDELLDRSIRHHVQVQKLIAGVVNRLQVDINDANRELLAEIDSRASTIEAGNVNSRNTGLLISALAVILHDAASAMKADFRRELKAFVAYENDFQARMLDDVMPIDVDIKRPKDSDLATAVFDTPVRGRFIEDWLEDLERARLDRITTDVQHAVATGQSVSDLLKLAGGAAFVLAARQLENLTRTVFNQSANTMRATLFGGNDHVVGAMQWHATLDEVTCFI